MTLISKNVYIDKLDDIVNEYNNTYHRTIKMKPIDVKDNTYINSGKEINDNDPKFKAGDHVRNFSDWSEEIFPIKEIKNTVPWTYVVNDLMVRKLLEYFMKKNCKRQIKKNLK